MSARQPSPPALARAGAVARAARRIVAAGAALGPAAPVAFAAGQVRDRVRPRSGSAVRNTSFTWVVADERLNTTVWLHDYWSDAYGIAPVLDAELVDADGLTVGCWRPSVPRHGSVAVDVAAICRDLGVPLPFEGQLLLTATHPSLVAGRPVQVLAEYRGPRGASGVHGQYGLQRRPAAQWISTMVVPPGDDVRSSVVVLNPYDGPGAARGARTVLKLYDADGRCRTAAVPRLAPRASRRLPLDEVFGDVPGFLAGRSGHLSVSAPCPVSRLVHVVEHGDGRVIVNHGTIDRIFDQAPGVVATDGGEPPQPVASLPVWCDERRETVVTLPNRWGPRPADATAVLDVYRLDGTPVASLRRPVPRNGLAVVRVGEALAEAVGGAAGPRVHLRGHAELRVEPDAGVTEWPATVDAVVGFEDDGRPAGEVQVGSDFFNAPDDLAVPGPLVRRTRVTAHVVAGEGRTSWFVLAHPTLADGSGPVPVRLRLLDAAGVERGSTERELPPHGALVQRLEDVWPDAAALLAPAGFGRLHVRCTEARLYGYGWVETDGEATFPIDHLIGG